MRKLGLLIVGAFAILSLNGCAAMPKRGEYTASPPPQVISATEGKGAVVFLRESAFTGGGISYYIYEDGRKIGALKSGTWFIHQSDPGQHTYMAETEAKDIITLNVEDGKKYFVVGSVGMGVWAGRPQLKESTEAYALPLLKDLDYLTRTIGYIPQDN